MATGGVNVHYILFSALRFLQFVLGITVCGLYGVDLHAASVQGKYQDSKWVYAVVVASLSAFTAVLYWIPFVLRIPFVFVWDSILFILWIALFGLFGNMYIHENPEGDSGIQRMKNAVWVDLTNAILWLISATMMAVYWHRLKKSRTPHTGRDHV